ncbi:uncharacterized protein LOC131845011 isoform X2 [Achroia grisella]|uniref:uncharacterized protein LOC131845011 isoform X2 n=1 Tax=Achroia grisella TaxID=688607 RepID=UPI0027D25DC6|nr:uncharacterized protein LOC131845011 isoform X2 [Achroia grisella]
MNKAGAPKNVIADLSQFCKSTFTLSFAVEVVGIEVWHDCNEGWLDLGPCLQGLKIQYNLYPGCSYDLDVLIWPHAAKFLQRRWIAFSIRHAFPVRVLDLQAHTAMVTLVPGTGAFGANAKNDKNSEVYLPPLKFGELRYFAAVMEAEESLSKFAQDLIWEAVENYIPASYLDGLFDKPFPVTDVRHKDTVICNVQEIILSRGLPEEIEEIPEPEDSKTRYRPDSKIVKEKEKKKVNDVTKIKFEIKLPGDNILAGTGRITPFEICGDRPPELGEIITLISSNNLPAQDDLPILFVNIETLYDIPFNDLKKLRITQLYTRWKIASWKQDSKVNMIKSKSEIKFQDHHVLPLENAMAAQVTATFLDNPFEIQLRGIREISASNSNPMFFGYLKGDHNFGLTSPPKLPNEDTDILIAVTKIDGRKLATGTNEFISGEYPLYPPSASTANLGREELCTNDINAIGVAIKPDFIVPSYLVLQAQMTLGVSLGLVGCRPKGLALSFSRLFALIDDTESVMVMLREISKMNDELIASSKRDIVLTGFALDVGDQVIFYLEGPTDGALLKIWEMTQDFYPTVKPVFSSSAKYSTRIYPEFLSATKPFSILKMYVPLAILLACPPIYVRPALPIPTRSAVLKIGRIISGKFRPVPCRSEMPSASELNSFRLELCVAPRPIPPVTHEDAARG